MPNLAAQCIVIGPVCGCVCLFVCGGTKVYRVVDNRLDDTQLQNDLDVLGDWTVKRQMNFNVEKCKFVHYGKRSIEFEYSLYGHPLCMYATGCQILVFF